MRGLYIHIPFCAHICSYCDFVKRIPFKDDEVKSYLKALVKELNGYKDLYNTFDTIYIGGGTPNYLSDEDLGYLLSEIAKCHILAKEYTIECNPELLTKTQAKLFKKYHINRVSLGLQTTSLKGLKLLNRHHTKEDAINAITILKDEGLTNINVDLIYGYFDETLEDVKDDIDFILSEDLTHVSAYSLILEDKTLLNLKHKESELDEDLIADMYLYINQKLEEAGFKHYEISNYAKEGFKSVHNLKYWSKDEYVGIGLGATSYLKHKRLTNTGHLYQYLNEKNDKEIEDLSLLDEKKEFIILGLRKVSGILKNDYLARFNTKIEDDFNYQKLIKYNLLYENDKVLKLTDRGLLLGNVVFEEFL